MKTGGVGTFKWTNYLKPKPAVYATATNEPGVVTTDDYTVFNNSGKDAYYKPEDGKYGLTNKIQNGKAINEPVDGVATSNYNSKVFKIPGKSSFRPSAYIRPGGDVDLTFGPLDGAALFFREITDSSYKYGWLSSGQLDSSWSPAPARIPSRGT